MKSNSVMDDLRYTIGCITTNFSTLETLLSFHVMRLVSDDPKIGTIVTCEMSFRNLLTLFDSLARHKIADAERLKRVADLVKRLDAAEQDRNRIIHSVYPIDQKGSKIIRLKATAKRGKGLKFAIEKVDPLSLVTILKEQHKLQMELESLYKDLYGEVLLSYN